MRALLWFRGKDLRVHDHAALHDVCRRAREVLPVFVLSPRYFAGSRPTLAPHRVQFLLDSLGQLQTALAARGSRLLVVAGPAERALPRLAAHLQASEVVALESFEPAARVRDDRVRRALTVPLVLHAGETLAQPGALRTTGGGMYQVFTPFSRAFFAQVKVAAPLPAPERLPPPPPLGNGLGDASLSTLPTLAELGLSRVSQLIPGGEPAARERLDEFLRERAARYHEDRDRMDLAATSRISADLRFGTLSVRTAYHAASRRLASRAPEALERFQLELLWREFAYHWLFERPGLAREPFRADFTDFPWADDDDGFAAWAEGRTGYPIVDAAARELLTTGYVHNRARMIAASFLTKHLLVCYARGEAHYLRWLVDADHASNNLGWQWAAGSGCDAQPYFRVWNPVAQGQRHDPSGDYVRRHVPELRALRTEHIHAPWTAPAAELVRAGIVLGQTYPAPIVDHAEARRRYLLVAETHLGERRAQRG